MSYIIYLKKDEDHVYAYYATSYRDPITRKPKSKRTYIGRVNPDTKEFLNPEDEKKLQSLSANETEQDPQTNKQTREDNLSDYVSPNLNKELNKVKESIQRQQITINTIQKEQKEIRKLFDMIERAIHLSATQE